MRVYLDCLPCILRQVLEASKMATDNADARDQIMEEAIKVLQGYHKFQNPPEIAREMHRIVKAHTGSADPYEPIKQRDLQNALRLLPQVRREVENKEDSLYWALKAAAAGNAMDSAITTDYDINRFDAEFEAPFAICDKPALIEKLQTAKSLLLIGDNTGETVFDGLLLSQFPQLKLTYAVRGAPVLNDTTADEAIASGIDQYADILPTGSDVPGVKLDECSDAFLSRFFGADIVISKGQGNFETLSDCPRDIFFLLKVKCPVVAHLLDVGLHGYVFKYRAHEQAGAEPFARESE